MLFIKTIRDNCRSFAESWKKENQKPLFSLIPQSR